MLNWVWVHEAFLQIVACSTGEWKASRIVTRHYEMRVSVSINEVTDDGGEMSKGE
jgi:hypothetical protein